MAKQVALKPFRYGTRQRIQPVGRIQFAAGTAAQPLVMPKIGMANRLLIQFRGTVTKSAAGALADSSPWGIISRLRFAMNAGSANVVDVSGYGLYATQQSLQEGFNPSNFAASPGSADVYAAPTATGTSPINFSLVVPLAVNNGAQADLACINLQAPEVQAQLEIVWGALTDYAADCTGITGTLYVSYVFYEIPPLDRFALPKLALCRLVEDTQPITATGDQTYLLQRQGTLMQLTHIVRCNGVRTDGVDSFTLKLNGSDTPVVVDRQLQRFLMRYGNDAAQDTGVFTHDFFRSYEAVNTGDLRDAYDTEATSVFQSIVTVSSGTTLGASNNSLNSVRRILQVLEG